MATIPGAGPSRPPSPVSLYVTDESPLSTPSSAASAHRANEALRSLEQAFGRPRRESDRYQHERPRWSRNNTAEAVPTMSRLQLPEASRSEERLMSPPPLVSRDSSGSNDSAEERPLLPRRPRTPKARQSARVPAWMRFPYLHGRGPQNDPRIFSEGATLPKLPPGYERPDPLRRERSAIPWKRSAEQMAQYRRDGDWLAAQLAPVVLARASPSPTRPSMERTISWRKPPEPKDGGIKD